MAILKKYGSSGNDRINTSKELEITSTTVSFGQTVYQLKNVTGFGVDRQPKGNDFLIAAGLMLLLSALFALYSIFSGASRYGSNDAANGFGICLFLSLGLAAAHFVERPSVFALYLNSGQTVYFLGASKPRLVEIVSKLQDCMRSGFEGKVINISISNNNRSPIIIGNENCT